MTVAQLGGLERFLRERRAASALSSAAAIGVLVIGLAATIEIVRSAWSTDRMARAARTAARAVALMPDAAANAAALEAVACQAIRRELRLTDGEGCDEAWTISVDIYESPSAMLAGTVRSGPDAVPGGENGDMVVVRIAWSRTNPLAWFVPDTEAEADDGTDTDGKTDAAESETIRTIVIGVARNERAVRA